MFYLIGLGLKPEHLSLEALKVLKKCKKVFLDDFTSVYSEGAIKDLEKLTGKKVTPLNRSQIEQGFTEYLLQAKTQNIALCIIGNALTATTHIQLLLDAKQKKIQFQVLPGISITNFISGTGLQEYKVGQTITIPFWAENFKPESFYDKFLENKLLNLHTLCLLDIKKEENKLMNVQDALGIFQEIEKKRSLSNITDSVLVIISSAGSKKQRISAGKLPELIKQRFSTPASIIICGKLNEKETEALQALAGLK